MATYTIRELQDLNSYRQGVEIEAADLTAAKRWATREQVFYGTILVVEDETGARLAVHDDNDGWHDVTSAPAPEGIN